MHQHRRQSQIFIIRSFCFAFDGISWLVLYYELLKSNETITGDRYQVSTVDTFESNIEEKMAAIRVATQ